MSTEEIYEIEKLVDCDTGNFAESKRALIDFHPDSLSATDECFKLLERIGILFGEACDYDKYNQQLNTWLKTKSGSPANMATFLEKATLIGEISEQDPVAGAKNSAAAGRQIGSGLAMQHRTKSSFLFLVLILVFGQAASAVTLFPSRSRGWNKIPTIVLLGRERDSKNQLVNDAVDFWNQQLTEIGSGFKVGTGYAL
jgi:hypothetical protein